MKNNHFNRSKIKKYARHNLFHNYFLNIIVVFAVSFVLEIGYRYSSRLAFLNSYHYLSSISGTDVISDTLRSTLDIRKYSEYTSNHYINGFLSVFINESTSSGSIPLGFLSSVNKLFFHNQIAPFIITFIMNIFIITLTAFVGNILRIGQHRYFLEKRSYKKTKIHRIFYIYTEKATLRSARTLVIMYIKLFLWRLTIIGGIIKDYEYAMIPYIIAENPKIPTREAFSLSKKMMNGHKMDAFLIELTLIPYIILNIFTLGILMHLLIRPYLDCIYAEMYAKLRSYNKSPYYTDVLLFPEKVQSAAYPHSDKTKHIIITWDNIPALPRLAISDYIAIFFFTSIFGWLWEVVIHLIQVGTYVNRGFFTGPWIPIYGFSVIIIIVLLRPLRNLPGPMFLAIMALTGTIEYLTSYILECIYNRRWWDYEGFFMNLNGRICLEGLIAFGLIGSLFFYLFIPIELKLIRKIKPNLKQIILVILTFAFLTDMAIAIKNPNTGKGISYNMNKRNTTYDQKRESTNNNR